MPVITTKEAFDTLKAALQADSEFAWGWHCNIAMAFVDESGVALATANRAAARFMKNCFGIDTSQSPQYATLKIAPVEWPDIIG